MTGLEVMLLLTATAAVTHGIISANNTKKEQERAAKQLESERISNLYAEAGRRAQALSMVPNKRPQTKEVGSTPTLAKPPRSTTPQGQAAPTQEGFIGSGISGTF